MAAAVGPKSNAVTHRVDHGTVRHARLLDRYRASGRVFTAAGISSFVLDEGPRDAAPVVCGHRVPASAYLYRKVVPALAALDLRGIAVDLPRLGPRRAL